MPEPSWASRYRVIEKLGAGSMGVVYRAEHRSLKREVALKTLLPNVEGTESLLERLRREAVSLSVVNHIGIAKVFEVSGPDEDPYLAMELVNGPTLEDAVRANPVAIRRQGDALFLGIAEAMAAVHAARLLHRDLKPSNVMIAPGDRPVVMDLGLVKDAGGRWGKMTGTGIIVGTPAYFAPELVRGEPATFRSDVWALGALYFFLHAGHAPFRGENALMLSRAICSEPLPDLDVACADLKEPQRNFLSALLERDPARRPADAGAVVQTFHRIGRAAPPPPRAKARARARVPWVAALAGLCAGLAAFLLWPRAPAVEPPPPSASAASLQFIPGAHSVAPPLFARWRSFTAFAGRLRAGGDDAATAVQELRRLSPVDFGSAPETWRHWLELGAWLDAPKGHWSDDHPANITFASLQPALLFSACWHAQVPSPRILVVTLDATLYAPRDAAGWLILGTLLEDEGATPPAEAAYLEGLHALGSGTLTSEAPVRVWRGLARALEMAPGRSLKADWRKHMPRGMAHRRPWRGLQLAVPAGDRKTVRALLQAAEDREQQAASAVLGADFELYDLDPEAARQHWEGMLVLRRNQEVENAAHEHWLARGSVANPRDVLNQDLVADLIAGPARELRDLKDSVKATRDHGRLARLARLLEARALPAAREEGERQVANGGLSATALVAELVRAGDFTEASDRTLRQLADRPDAVWADLDRLAGAVSAPLAPRWFVRRVDRHTGRTVGSCIQLALALWHSRSDRHAEALNALEPLAAAAHVRAEHGDALTEIHSRPLWQSLAGRHPESAVLARLPAGDRPPALLHRRSAELWRELRAGDRVKALAFARDAFDALPRAHVSQLGLAWAAAAAPDRTLTRTLIDQARAAARYQGGPLWVLDEIERVERGVR